MKLHLRRAMAVYWKDMLDLRKNRALLFSMLALPLVLVLVPVGVIWAYVHNGNDGDLRAMAMFYEPDFPLKASAARYLVDKTLTDWFGLYLVMPVFVPILISSHSIAGEKERRTLEPLLATPITAAELVLGKSLASVVPACVISVFAYLLLCLSVDVVAWPMAHAPLLPNGLWTFGVLVIAPLFAFFGNGVAVIVSARVAEARLAQQLSALVVLPLMGLVGGQLAGFLRAGPQYYAMQAGVVAVLDVGLMIASVRLLDRERLLSRWA